MDNPGDGIDDLAVLTDLLAALDDAIVEVDAGGTEPVWAAGRRARTAGRVDHVVP